MSGSQRRHAIVTMLVGDRYIEEWDKYCRNNWLAYGKRHDCDVIVLTEPVLPDAVTPERTLHWQKLLIPSLPALQRYEQVVWLDGDILINSSHAPSIFNGLDPDHIAVVDISLQLKRRLDTMTTEQRWVHLLLMAQSISANQPPVDMTQYDFTFGNPYAADGLQPAPQQFINTGVFVFSPARHAAFFRRVFQKYPRNSRNGDFEQTPLSFEILTSGLAQFLDQRFNTIWALEVAHHYPFLFGSRFIKPSPADRQEWRWLARQCVTNAFFNTYFLHFAGAPGTMLKSTMALAETTVAEFRQFLYPA